MIRQARKINPATGVRSIHYQQPAMSVDRKLTMDELGRIAPEDYKAMAKGRVRVLLDDVRSRHNVGSIFRTADAFGAEGIVLCGFTPCPPHREIEKTALGATLSVPWEHIPSVEEAITSLKREGYAIWCVEQTVLAVPLNEWQLPKDQGVVFVFGNELQGVSAEAIALCDGALVLPQKGTKHSLNVSVCAGIVLWHASDRAGIGFEQKATIRL
jgi:23S rRNA (guanosine2251-2'-O)-methyltransferase